ncbi:ketopantoate reductase family protein [Vibrio algicola]|uniref:2-dehydropantoate 2-reductase n=1 Tax=Vibrio algicola TaxID=2662262 RepID=A0A5Q0TEY7_9VIBR|nr:2-dehydropantoate 2-reductase [Vibrio algicola]
MKIGIVGLGAIGSLWAVKLQQSGHNVYAYTRHANQSHIKVQLDNRPTCRFDANNLEQLAQCECVLVTVKSTQVMDAITPLFPYLSSNTTIIFMHNGMGAIDVFQDQLNRFPTYLATTTQAAFKPQANQVEHTGLGETFIGAYEASSVHRNSIENSIINPRILTALNHALAPVTWHHDIQTALWHKLAINCAINPLTAIHQCKNGELANNRFDATLSKLIAEINQVMQAQAVPISKQALHKAIYQVINATQHNYSSMQQDVAHQRPTEIEFITGYLIRSAAQHNIDVPTNLALYHQLINAR